MTDAAELVKLVESMIEDVEADPRVTIPDAAVLSMLDRIRTALAAQQDVREAKPGDRPHKIMTRKEYMATTIKGWHSVCHNYDGGGNTAIRYHGEQVADAEQ